ncbi:MAG: carotenoid oxygenase family protein [Myxococcales bacterium]
MQRPATVSAAPRPWFRAFESLAREHGDEPMRIEGRLPEGLSGTLVRNGPSLFENHGERYGHWFDGDGAVSAVRFGGGEASSLVRVVQSAELQEERKAGKRIFGIYGTAPAGGPLARLRGRYKNVANTSVMAWQDRLFALYEAGLPTELDPADLSTVGATDLGGVIPNHFSAHPHRVRARRALYNFGMRYGRETLLDLFELPDEGSARRIGSVPLPGPTMVHDFIATDTHLVFLVSPLRLKIFRTLLGIGTVVGNLAWAPGEGTEVLVVPLDAPDAPVRFTAEPFFQWHFSNAFEREGRLVVDLVAYRDFAHGNWFDGIVHGELALPASGTFRRAVLDPAAKTLRMDEVWDRPCEFPRIAPAASGRPYRYAYVAAAAKAADGQELFQRVAKLDVERGEAVEADVQGYPSEPVFVPRPGGTAEDDGWVLSLVYEPGSHASHVAVLDASTLGILARVHFGHAVPFTFHGGFIPQQR